MSGVHLLKNLVKLVCSVLLLPVSLSMNVVILFTNIKFNERHGFCYQFDCGKDIMMIWDQMCVCVCVCTFVLSSSGRRHWVWTEQDFFQVE